MIELLPYEAELALRVFRALDPHDKIEAELVRGAATSDVTLFAEWHGANGWRLASFVVTAGALRSPFAVLGLSNTGQAGVGQAALLAARHSAHRRSLARLARILRRDLPDWAARHSVHRIECRAWARHPTAPGFLASCGFALEAPMPGFAAGRETFLQFAWTHPPTKET